MELLSASDSSNLTCSPVSNTVGWTWSSPIHHTSPTESDETLDAEVRDYEPAKALFAGPTGLEIYERLIPQAANALRPGGWLLMEIGAGQQLQLSQLLKDWSNVSFVPRSARNSESRPRATALERTLGFTSVRPLASEPALRPSDAQPQTQSGCSADRHRQPHGRHEAPRRRGSSAQAGPESAAAAPA